MEKRIILNGQETSFWINTEGRVRNEKSGTWYKGAVNKGYKLYNLYFNGKQYTLYAHRLVAEYFVPNPNNYNIVHHIDGNKLNNNACNLEWLDEKTHSQEHGQGYSRKPITIDEQQIKVEDLASFRGTPYYASRDGQIYNMNKKTKMRFETTGNYYRVQCHYGLGGKHFSVHRIIWESFNGPVPEGYEINHIDGNPHNNALDNLELTTHKENCRKANHRGMKILSVNTITGEETHYPSLNQACKAAFGNKNTRKMHDIIKDNKIYNNCHWYYEE